MPVIIGQKYTKLTPIYELPERTKSRGKIYHCICDCGNEIDVPGASLVTNNTKSCGCLHVESAKLMGERIRQRNKYDLSGSCGIGWTCNTNREFYFDFEDYDIIKNYHWNEKTPEGYIVTTIWKNNKPRQVFMHRLIMQKHGYDISDNDIDHRSHKTYDNQKSNLRVCHHYQNIIATKTYSNNTSGRKGVYWDKEKNKWAVYITTNKKTKFIGRYENFEDAVKAREEAEQIYHREFHYDDCEKEIETNV
jgi:hypothetical protein